MKIEEAFIKDNPKSQPDVPMEFEDGVTSETLANETQKKKWKKLVKPKLSTTEVPQ